MTQIEKLKMADRHQPQAAQRRLKLKTRTMQNSIRHRGHGDGGSQRNPNRLIATERTRLSCGSIHYIGLQWLSCPIRPTSTNKNKGSFPNQRTNRSVETIAAGRVEGNSYVSERRPEQMNEVDGEQRAVFSLFVGLFCAFQDVVNEDGDMQWVEL